MKKSALHTIQKETSYSKCSAESATYMHLAAVSSHGSIHWLFFNDRLDCLTAILTRHILPSKNSIYTGMGIVNMQRQATNSSTSGQFLGRRRQAKGGEGMSGRKGRVRAIQSKRISIDRRNERQATKARHARKNKQ